MERLLANLKVWIKNLRSSKNCTVQDYRIYSFSDKELVRYCLTSLAVCFIVSILFFDNIWFVLLLIPYCITYLRNTQKKLAEERRWRLNIEFCDCVNSLSASLEAGYSIENAIGETIKDMLLVYKKTDMIIAELSYIERQVLNNVTLEKAFEDLSVRSGVEDIKSFADIFTIAKRTGGDIIAIIRFTAGIIHMRVETKREMATAIAAKKYEVNILKLVPFGILIYLRLCSPDMIEGLYNQAAGTIFMIVILIVYYFLIRLAEHIMTIEL